MAEAELKTIPVSKIVPSPYQPREKFDKELLRELSESIKSLDLLEPLIVRPNKGGFQIACGERRWRAAQMAGWDKLPAIVRELDDRGMQLYSLVENLHRLDLSSSEKEKAVYGVWKSYYKKENKSYANLARDLGMSESWVGDLVAAHEERTGLDERTREAVTTHDLRVTRGLEDPLRKKLLRQKAAGKISQTDLEEIVPIVKEAPPEKRAAIVEETTQEIADVRELVKDEARSFAKGEMEAREIKVQLDADQKRLNRFLETRNQVQYWSVATIEMIQGQKLRKRAVEYIEDTRDHSDKLLKQLERRGWYAR